MKKISLIAIALFLVNSAYAGETLKACGHPDYPPFMWQENNRTTGAATEIAQIIFGELGITVDNRFEGTWGRCQKEIELGRYDLLVSGYINDERKVYADFTATHISADPTAVFVWKGKEFKFDKWEDLIGKNMGGILGGSIGKEWDEFSARKLNVINVSTRLQLFHMLEQGRIDFTPTGLFSGQIQIAKSKYKNRIVPLENHIKTEYLHVAISKRSPYLKHLPYVSKRLLELRNDGTVKRIIDKHIAHYSKEK